MMKKTIIILFLCGFYRLAISQALIEDQSYLDPSFWKFKAKLEEAVLKREVKLLAPLLADTVLESNDGCGYCTTEEFINYYFQDVGSTNDKWQTLQTIIRFGFTRKLDEDLESIVQHDSIVFQAPSYLDKIDTDNKLLVLGEQVNVREKPTSNGRIIKSILSFYDCYSSHKSTFLKDHLLTEAMLKQETLSQMVGWK